MAVIFGTSGHDDGVSGPLLTSSATPSTIFGLEGDDVLVSSSRPFDPTPDVLVGGSGNDTYRLGALGSYFIYSTPIIWVLYAGDVIIREDPNAADAGDHLDLRGGGYDVQTSALFNGNDLIIYTFGRSVTLENQYGVDAVGNLTTGIETVTMQIYGPPPAGSNLDAVVYDQVFDLRLQSAEFGFLRNGSANDDNVSGDDTANVIEGGDGADALSGLGGHDFITGGRGADVIDGGEGDDRLFGGDDADSLRGDMGNDLLRGMAGSDDLQGGLGDDAYLIGLGDGNDTISDAGGAQDAIRFGLGINRNTVTLTDIGDNLEIRFADQVLTVLGQSSGSARIERIEFADGSSMDIGSGYNHAPIAQDDVLAVVAGRTINANLLVNNGAGADSDSDGDVLSLSPASFTTANGGLVTIAANGALNYVAAAGFAGADSFSYVLNDPFGATDSGLVTVNVAANLAPITRADLFNGTEDQPVSGNVLASNGNGADVDPNGDALSVLGGTHATAQGGTVTIQAGGTFLYTPRLNFRGQDSFTYTVNDGFGLSSMGTATIQLAGVNDAPTAGSDNFTTSALTRKTGNLLANDHDPDGDSLSAVPAGFVTARGGYVTVNADGTFAYQNYDGHVGSDFFSYTVIDGLGGQSTGSVQINLTAPAGARLGTASDDVLAGAGTADFILGLFGRDEMSGGGGGDRLYGGFDDDDIDGNDGADKLYGGTGNDKLNGGAGNDQLFGGAGADDLKGEGGADRFVFLHISDGLDTVRDFSLKQKDKLDLSDLLDAPFNPLTQLASDFVRITNVAGVSAGSLVEVDVDGAAGPAGFVSVALLLGVTGLTNEDALFGSGHLILT